MNKKTIIFNWKMNPSSLREAQALADLMRKCVKKMKSKKDVIIAPPFVYLSNLVASAVAKGYGGLRFASQDAFWAAGGAYTGEISAKMLKNMGVKYVIIGHSERRKYLAETDEIINKKVIAALKSGLKVILCVGEIQRTTNDKQPTTKAKKFVKNQLAKDLKGIPRSLVVSRKSSASNLLVVYEPVWAISTSANGKACKPEDALEMIKFIKSSVVSRWSLVIPVIYGGSVDSKNIESFLEREEIDGALVGAASLKPKEIVKILK